MQIFLVFLAFFVVGVLLSLLLNKLFKNRKYIKYLVGLLILAFGVYFIIYARMVGGGFEALGTAIMGIFLSFMAIISIITSGFVDLIKKYKSKQ